MADTHGQTPADDFVQIDFDAPEGSETEASYEPPDAKVLVAINSLLKTTDSARVRDPILEAKYRWIQGTLLNYTPFRIIHIGSYIYEGRSWIAAGGLTTLQTAEFSACTADDTDAGGVSGADLFTINAFTNRFTFGIAWAHQASTTFETGIAQLSEHAASKPDAVKIAWKNLNAEKEEKGLMSVFKYRGQILHHEPGNFRFRLTATSGQNPTFILSQHPV